MVHFPKKIWVNFFSRKKTKPVGLGGLAKDQTFSGFFWIPSLMTASQINDTYGLQSGVKVKVVGEVSEG